MSRNAFGNVKPNHGTNVSVTTSAAAIVATTPTIPAVHGVIVQALSTNTASIYVGGSGVATTTGLELEAGKSVVLPVRDASTIYAISGSGTQSLRYLYV